MCHTDSLITEFDQRHVSISRWRHQSDLAEQIVRGLSLAPAYQRVETDGAETAARKIAELL